MMAFWQIVRRDLLLARRQGASSLLGVAFFVIVVSLFPFAVGPDAIILASIGAGIIWVAALLATLLSLDRLFQADFEDGSLDILVLTRQPIAMLVLAKTLAHWLTTALPLIIASPLLAMFMALPVDVFATLVISLAVGTPALSLIGAVGAALTVGMRRGGVLMSLLVLPLYIPVLIFGVGAMGAAMMGQDASSALMLLGAISLFALVLAPIGAAAALRLALE
ncbi:MAG: heme exporter protein CcmB [Alphaproteobacteria bacterium]|nr:MAG: heme exporter protein CcmB [Alphaproteobacteria bacterium]